MKVEKANPIKLKWDTTLSQEGMVDFTKIRFTLYNEGKNIVSYIVDDISTGEVTLSALSNMKDIAVYKSKSSVYQY